MLVRKFEMKYNTVVASAQAATTTMTIFPITAIPQNTSDTGRIGDQVNLLSYQFKYHVACGDPTNIVRVALFQWLEDDTVVVPTATQLFQLGPSGSAGDIYSTWNHDRRKMYRVLYDKRHFLAGNGTAATSPFSASTQRHHNHRGKFKKKTIEYVSALTTGMGNLYICYVADSSILPNPTITYDLEFYYTDP